MDNLRIGVIGTGHLGSLHAKVYSLLEKNWDISLAGVCDTRKSVVEEIAKKYNTAPFTNYHDLLGKIDAVGQNDVADMAREYFSPDRLFLLRLGPVA